MPVPIQYILSNIFIGVPKSGSNCLNSREKSLILPIDSVQPGVRELWEVLGKLWTTNRFGNIKLI